MYMFIYMHTCKSYMCRYIRARTYMYIHKYVFRCDRILWKSNADTIKLIHYKRSLLFPSDHKPISALFNSNLKIINNEKEKEVYNNIIKKLENSKNNSLPEVEISGLKIEILDLKYDVPSNASVLIRNTGSCIIYWRFVPKLEETRICRRWVMVCIYI
jgi:phosphatidylinositol-bisphosphatase